MAFLVGLIVTLVAVPLAILVSPRLGLMDQPSSDPLKIHRRPVPRAGGVAVALGVAGAALTGGEAPLPLVFGGGAALALGLVDDRWRLPAGFRLLLETVMALAVALLLTGGESWWRVALGAVVILVAINAANLFDGLDGLLPAAGMLTALGLALIVSGPARVWLWGLTGALLGFLAYNRPPARIFLGDGGAYLLGMILGVGLIEAGSRPSPFLGGVVIFGLIGVDFVLTLVRRWRGGRPLFAGDRSHLYDQLLDRGRSAWGVLVLVSTIQVVMVGVGLAIAHSPPAVALGGMLAVLAIAIVAVWRFGFVSSEPTG